MVLQLLVPSLVPLYQQSKPPIAQAKPKANPSPMVDIFVVLSMLFPFKRLTFEFEFYSKKSPSGEKGAFYKFKYYLK